MLKVIGIKKKKWIIYEVEESGVFLVVENTCAYIKRKDWRD